MFFLFKIQKDWYFFFLFTFLESIFKYFREEEMGQTYWGVEQIKEWALISRALGPEDLFISSSVDEVEI